MNSILKTTVLVFFFSFLLQDYCYGQASLGRFTLNGQAETNVAFAKQELHSYRLLEAEGGYVFFDRFLATAGYRYEAKQNLSQFTQRYAVRYSIVRSLPLEIFAGLSFSRSKMWYKGDDLAQIVALEKWIPEFLTLYSRGSAATFKYTALLGSSYFLNPTVAVEASVGLPVFDTSDFHDYSDKPDVVFNLGLRYFWGAQNKVKTSGRDTSFSKKRMLGFSLDLVERGNLSLDNLERSFDMSIDFGFVLGRLGMIGIKNRFIHSKLNQTMTFGINPFGRLYFLALQKSKIYWEGQLYVNLFRFDITDKVSEIRNDVPVFMDVHFGLGWTRKLRENLRLDFFAGLKVYQSFDKDWDPDLVFKSSDRPLKFRLGIERYF